MASAQTPAFVTPAAAVGDLNAEDPAKLFTVVNGTVEKAVVDGVPVIRWKPVAGQASTLEVRREHPIFARMLEFDRLLFEVRTTGVVNDIGITALGHVSGPRRNRIHQTGMAVLTTPTNVWLTREFDFNRPNWLPWINPDGDTSDSFFRISCLALEPGSTIEIRSARFVRGLVSVKPAFEMPITWPVKAEAADGSVTYTMDVHVTNGSTRPTTLAAKIASKHERFKVTLDKDKLEAKNGATVVFKVTATISKDAIASSPELYDEPLLITFATQEAPEAVAWYRERLVRPLSKGLLTQVIVAADDLKLIREKLAAGDKQMESLTESARILAGADAFLPIKLVAIPQSSGHVSNNIPTGWRAGDYMPEIVNTATGQREAFTPTAMNFWKSYLNVPGAACENVGMSYLLTGDEKYAEKAVELMKLYGMQYDSLPFNRAFGNPPGAPLLGDSRVSAVATYGTNWLFKGHLRMLSMVSESKAWAAADKKAIYDGFVLPYATEIMKFHGGISNMTDITNHNLLLLGLVFDDAGMVRFALRSEPGLASRLRDITADGFSSEGRPLNYHFAAMAEYLPTINYLELSGLKIDYPKDRIPAALRMPYQRATLSGMLPSTGDCARGMQVGAQPLADQVAGVFPNEKWLADIGRASTLSTKVRRYASGSAAPENAWRSLLETKPHLFKDAGLAILRTGDTAHTQVYTTLDYGRNFFHAALDRNQITLYAFGRMFTAGPGSLYNVGSGGITRTKDAKLESFITHDSLAQNLVMVDATNQDVAVGKLLAWSDKPEMQFAVSRVDAVKPGVSHTRGLVLVNGVVVVLDRVESADEHTYDFVYHNFGTATPGDGWKATPLAEPLSKTGNYENIKDPQKLAGAGPIRMNWDLSKQNAEDDPKWAGPETIGLALWQLPVNGGAVYTGVTGLNNPNNRVIPDAAPSLFHRVKAKSVSFATVLEPHTGTPRVKAIAGKDASVTVTFTDGKSVELSLDALIKQSPAK